MDSKGRSVGTDRPSPPSPDAPSFAAALARDLDAARAGSAARDEDRSGQVEESVQATIDERAERVATERTNAGDAAEEALAERAEEHRAETEPADREPDRGDTNDRARPESESSSSDSPAPREEAHDEPATSAGPGASASDPVDAPAPVAPPATTPAAEPATPVPTTPTAASPTTGGIPLTADPALSGMAAPVAPGSEVAARVAGAEPTTAATPAVGTAGEGRTVSMRSVTSVEGRPAPTEADLERADRVLDTIRVRLQPGLRQATIQLQPAELGRVLIRLRLENGTARAVVRAESPEALAILEKHVPELRAMFEQQGFEGLELDLGLASESTDGDELTPEFSGESTGEEPAEAPLDEIELARALNEMDGLDLWA